MIYQLVSAKVVIARVLKFNISYSDWIPRTNDLILSALREMHIVANLAMNETECNCVDYKVELPCDIESLKGVWFEGERITQKTNSDETSNVETSYKLLNNNYLEIISEDTTFQNTTILIKWKGFPLEYDSQYNTYFPLIPNVENLIEALAFYILINAILYRGYKHPVFDLNSNSPFTNPAIIYGGVNGKSGLKLKARSDCAELNEDSYRHISNAKNSLLNNRDSYYNE